MYLYLLTLTFAQAVAFLGWTSLFNNFAVERAGFSGADIGIVNAVREVPGLLSIAVILLLRFLREVTLTSLSILLLGIGVILAGFFPSLSGQLACTLLLSTGFHFFEATNQSLTLQYFNIREAPIIIGRLRSAMAAGNFFSIGLIFVLATHLDFRFLFALTGAVAVAAGIWALGQRPDMAEMPRQRRGMVLKARYRLFYVLTGLAGARRQIFTVFALFLLVQHFHFSLRDMALLLLFNNLVNWLLNPYIGRIINAWGERRILAVKYICIIMICISYAFFQNSAVIVCLYVADQFVFNFAVSIRTFFQKIALPEDISPSMAVGVTINHIAAVFIPLAGGALWMYDYRLTFLLGAVLAFLSLLAVARMPGTRPEAGL
ncbi:MAG: MFS transporter [Desulfovibrio sp.]|jgi:predicted MFS family arabinose efflux permease|nr:MFS transporter [Desulfovibrio sp.]